jgi:hypothetical protein
MARTFGQVAQLVEQGTENPRVGGSIPPLATTIWKILSAPKPTFCYASPTDPQDAVAYTRAGLEVVFRPSDKKVKEGKTSANTKGFFSMKNYATEEERRSDLGKWETVLHGNKSMRGSSLDNPVFDIHYNAREAGGPTASAEKIRYALIITVEAPKHADLYNEILRAYAKTLVPIQPKVTLPVRV